MANNGFFGSPYDPNAVLATDSVFERFKLIFLFCPFCYLQFKEIADPSEYPGLYLKVGSYLDWISAVINADYLKNSPQNEQEN